MAATATMAMTSQVSGCRFRSGRALSMTARSRNGEASPTREEATMMAVTTASCHTLVEVTEHGAATLDAIRAARGAEAGRVFGRLSPADRADLARILSQLQSDPGEQG
jgi:hypothetical protein